MKLTSIQPQIKTDKVEVKKPAGKAAAESPTPVAPADRVELSAGSAEVQKMREILDQTPEIREDRIRELKNRIERGEYRVDAYAVADKLLRTLLQDALLD